jgi:single stranded DNA-binding protein
VDHPGKATGLPPVEARGCCSRSPNLVEDPEVRFTHTGIAVANLRVAVTQRVQQDGQWRDGDTSFFKVNVWRGQAEHLAESLGKGDRVMVTGRLRQRAGRPPKARSGRSPN